MKTQGKHEINPKADKSREIEAVATPTVAEAAAVEATPTVPAQAELTTTESVPAAKAGSVDLGNLGYDPSNPETTQMKIPVEKVREKPVLKSTATESMREVFAKFRGKHVKYGNTKEDFSRFVTSNKKSLVLILCIVLCVLAVMTLAVWFVSNDNKYVVEGTVVQYYAGQSYTVPEGAVISRGLDEETTLTTSDGEKSLNALVYYIEGEETIILPQDMIYYNPYAKSYASVAALSEVTCSSLQITASNGKNTVDLTKGFLFDGSDYYIFLEDVTLYYSGYSIALSKLSYIEAVYQNYMVVFNYETKESIVIEMPTAVLVTASGGEYTLNLVNDMIEYSTEEKALLFTRPDLLSSVFDE